MQSNNVGSVISNKERSVCDVAYADLCGAQNALAEAVGFLHSRLSPVLSGDNSASGPLTSQAGLSEVHGWLVASTERTQETTERIRSITASLTI